MLNKFFVLLAFTSVYTTHALHGEMRQTEESLSISDAVIRAYFESFKTLSKAEKWAEILSQGSIAIEAAKNSNRESDEAKIAAQLASTSFYLGNYEEALLYARRSYRLAEKFDDPTLFMRALYLESAIYRALAPKEDAEEQVTYARAVTIAEQAANTYSKMGVENNNLKGKIYFNLGAAHADNPKGSLEEAKSAYEIAIACFEIVGAVDDVIRTTIRLGKVHFLQKEYEECQQVINEIRPLIASERLAMQTDYLEAQLKFALHDFEEALKVATIGLERARALGAKQDEARLLSLLRKIETEI
ncbi:MAG: hypothetical protein JSR76_05080 [Verrucomicrobia bacterium]|nr:hypothetical protein [Verrucomicrobiota bacterium]